MAFFPRMRRGARQTLSFIFSRLHLPFSKHSSGSGSGSSDAPLSVRALCAACKGGAKEGSDKKTNGDGNASGCSSDWLLWCIALVYCCATFSYYIQFKGLNGADDGLLPFRYNYNSFEVGGGSEGGSSAPPYINSFEALFSSRAQRISREGRAALAAYDAENPSSEPTAAPTKEGASTAKEEESSLLTTGWAVAAALLSWSWLGLLAERFSIAFASPLFGFRDGFDFFDVSQVGQRLGIDSDQWILLLFQVAIAVSVGMLLSRRLRQSVFPHIALLCLYFTFQTRVGQTFINFQWDLLLMEVGFAGCLVALSISSAPRAASPYGAGAERSEGEANVSSSSSSSASSRPLFVLLSPGASFTGSAQMPMFLIRVIAFKLMFMSGSTKVLSGCGTWKGLTATQYHYATQCIPSPAAWYFHNYLAPFYQHLSVAIILVSQMAVSVTMLLPIPSVGAAVVHIGCQAMIILTGNYNFFNWLSIFLCAEGIFSLCAVPNISFFDLPRWALWRLRGGEGRFGKESAAESSGGCLSCGYEVCPLRNQQQQDKQQCRHVRTGSDDDVAVDSHHHLERGHASSLLSPLVEGHTSVVAAEEDQQHVIRLMSSSTSSSSVAAGIGMGLTRRSGRKGGADGVLLRECGQNACNVSTSPRRGSHPPHQPKSSGGRCKDNTMRPRGRKSYDRVRVIIARLTNIRLAIAVGTSVYAGAVMFAALRAYFTITVAPPNSGPSSSPLPLALRLSISSSLSQGDFKVLLAEAVLPFCVFSVAVSTFVVMAMHCFSMCADLSRLARRAFGTPLTRERVLGGNAEGSPLGCQQLLQPNHSRIGVVSKRTAVPHGNKKSRRGPASLLWTAVSLPFRRISNNRRADQLRFAAAVLFHAPLRVAVSAAAVVMVCINVCVLLNHTVDASDWYRTDYRRASTRWPRSKKGEEAPLPHFLSSLSFFAAPSPSGGPQSPAMLVQHSALFRSTFGAVHGYFAGTDRVEETFETIVFADSSAASSFFSSSSFGSFPSLKGAKKVTRKRLVTRGRFAREAMYLAAPYGLFRHMTGVGAPISPKVLDTNDEAANYPNAEAAAAAQLQKAALRRARERIDSSVANSSAVSRLFADPPLSLFAPFMGEDGASVPPPLANAYGAVANVARPEVIIEGSDTPADPSSWRPYSFPYKPSDVDRAPPLVAPHQPRLDWQMWFAALAAGSPPPWLLHLVYKLLSMPPSRVTSSSAGGNWEGKEDVSIARWLAESLVSPLFSFSLRVPSPVCAPHPIALLLGSGDGGDVSDQPFSVGHVSNSDTEKKPSNSSRSVGPPRYIRLMLRHYDFSTISEAAHAAKVSTKKGKTDEGRQKEVGPLRVGRWWSAAPSSGSSLYFNAYFSLSDGRFMQHAAVSGWTAGDRGASSMGIGIGATADGCTAPLQTPRRKEWEAARRRPLALDTARAVLSATCGVVGRRLLWWCGGSGKALAAGGLGGEASDGRSHVYVDESAVAYVADRIIAAGEAAERWADKAWLFCALNARPIAVVFLWAVVLSWFRWTLRALCSWVRCV